MRRETETKKNVIFFARDYRHFRVSTRATLVNVLCFVLPVVLFFLCFYSGLTRIFCTWAGRFIAQITGAVVEMRSTPFIPYLGSVYFLSLPGTMPSFAHALIAGILTILCIPVSSQSKPPARPEMIYITMGLYVLLASCIFFVFWPDYFPYNLTDYSELYMLQSAALWIILPALFGVAVALLRSGFWVRIFAIFAQILVMLIYDIVRYVVYLCLLRYISYLYMATMFFTFGVLFDFLQMVMVYGFFAKKVSEGYSTVEGRARWAWS